MDFGAVPGRGGGCNPGDVPGGKTPGTGEGAEAGAEVGSGGVRSADILLGRPPSEWPARERARLAPRASEVGPRVAPMSVAVGWRAPPGGAHRYCPESRVSLVA